MNSASKRSIVLFLHGFLGSGADFDSVISQLHDRCLTLDLPGHGATQFSGEYTMSKTANAIVDLLNELQIDQVNLVGYSMGARLALYLALNYPNRFPKAAIESGSPGLKTERARLERIQRDRQFANQLEIDFDQFLINWYNQPLFRSFKAHPQFEQMLKARSRNSPVELARSLREMGTGMQPSLWKRLKIHRNPLLLIAGECDRKFVEINQEMASLCETAELAIAPNAGHNVHFEKLEWYVCQINAFFNES
ncbi:MAG TPA: 2-succinyl-6-hydroxy-2,4-cyclohexadiene-1-carboxylate synthase [Leptolyngbya sp.]|nr:2-succinyl-6-hydroxy-2,4-cyclohexadiene-1-carboxylate synthase [Leptolyngbya sp.]